MPYKKPQPNQNRKKAKPAPKRGKMGIKSPAQLVQEKKMRKAYRQAQLGKPLPKKKKIPKKPLRKPLKSRNLAKRKKK